MVATGMKRERVTREKGFNVWGMALVVHGAVLDCRECLDSGGWVESCRWWFVT